MDRNLQEIALLKEDPGQLIVTYQSLIQIIVSMFIKSGVFADHEREDVIQHVNEKLLNRINKLRDTYNGMSKLRTYMAAVIRNICIERSREMKMNIMEEPLAHYEHSPSSDLNQVQQLAIRQELERLDHVLTLYHSQRNKLEFCLKLLYRFPVTDEDILGQCHSLPNGKAEQALQYFYECGNLYTRQVYKHLNAFFNFVEDKNNVNDALRKWLRLRIETLISLMNGNPPRAWYTEESFQILVEKYFAEKTNLDHHQNIFIVEERIPS